MVDLTEQERAALRAAMRAMAEVTVGAFQDAMRASASPSTPEIPF